MQDMESGLCLSTFATYRLFFAATFVNEGLLSWDTTLSAAFPQIAGEMQDVYKDVTIGIIDLPAAATMSATRFAERVPSSSFPGLRLAHESH